MNFSIYLDWFHHIKSNVIICVFYGYDDIHQLTQKRGKTKSILEMIGYDIELWNIGFFELSVEVC